MIIVGLLPLVKVCNVLNFVLLTLTFKMLLIGSTIL